VRFLEQAVSKRLAGETTFLNLGNLHAREGNSTRALPYFEQARKNNPQNVRTLFGLALCYLKTGNLAQEKDLLRQVIKLDPNHEEARQVLGQLPGR
jgi:Flp pilus assembly protein TadD